MAFFRQFQLLLWKNGLAVIRHPVWSLTLIIWPLIIFIILAVTRHQFPPIVRETCYAAPRNLPSTGLFPFLQTLMCNTDSSCHNKSRLVEPTISKSRNARSLKESSPLESISQVEDLLNLLPSDVNNDQAELFKLLDILGSPYKGSPRNATLRTLFNSTGLENQDSANLLKRAICTVALPMLNKTSTDVFTYAVRTFCMTNSTVLEVSLYTLDQLLTEWMLTQPEKLMKMAGGMVTLFDQLQNDTLLWDSLLALPQLFSGDDQLLSSIDGLLRNLQGVVNVIQNNIPETNGSLSKVHPLLAGGITVINYVTHWPGKNVTIPLGDLVTNDSLGTVMKYLVEDVLDYRIPLHKAFGLMLDKDVVRSYLCDNSSNIFWSAVACSSGIVDKVLHAISPEKAAKQVFLVWSRDVAIHDMHFASGLLHSLIGDLSSGAQEGSNITRVRRSTETQPQNTEEELFLNIGQAVMEFVQTVPKVDTVVQGILQTSFHSMMLATVTMDTVEEILSNVLEDANQLQMTYRMLLTNESETSVWLGRVLDSVMEVVMKMMSPGNVKCEECLAPLEWLLSSNSIKNEVWRAMICPSNHSLQQALLLDWMPLIQKAQGLYSTLTGKPYFNITLSMILSEWHELYENSTKLSERLSSVSQELGEEYWKNWIPDNNTQLNTGTLQKSLVWFLISLGERIEKSDLWPTVKDYFYMAYWILNYSPDVTTQPANCSFNMNISALHCDADLSWPQFVQAMTQALMSPSNALVNWLKGSVNLLQHVYGNIYKNLTASYVKQEITGGDALSVYLINLMNNLNDFLSMISKVPNQNITNPDDMIPHIGNLLESVGLSPLVPLLSNKHPLNASAILCIASKLGRLNQDVFTFNVTDPAIPHLEELIMQFLSLEVNLTLSLPQIMGHSLLTYSQYLHPDEMNHLIKSIQPFSNQTSAGFVEAIISAVELLKTLMDAPNGDPTNVILGYIRQIQEFVVSLCRLQKIEQVMLPNGSYSIAQVTDLSLLSMDFLNLLTPESLQNLTQVGPDAAQDIVIQKFVAFLPKEVQSDAVHFLQDFKALQSHITNCTAGKDCLAGISGIFTFLDQILDVTLTASGNVTIKIAPTSSVPKGWEYEDTASIIFSLLLPPNDTAHLETFKQTLEFIKLVMNTPNITVFGVQSALTQSNLTIEDLNAIAALAGAANINELLVNIMEIASAEKCFEPQNDMMETTKCVMGLINRVSIFLTQVPSLHNNTAILSLIPVIVNKTISDFTHINYTSNPNMVLADSLNLTLANIKMSLEQSQMNTSEIMNEIKVLEGLIQLIANVQPVNTTQVMDPVHVQKVYLELVEWYLKRLENITSDSAISMLLHPVFSITQMQVALQLSQTNFSLFVSDKVQFLINSLQGSVDGNDLSKTGQTTIEILRHLLDLININLESWSNINGSEQQFNTTILHSTELQIKQYLNLIEKWLKDPNVPALLSSILQWENTTMATPVTDLNQFLQTMADFLTDDQRAYLSIISNITESLSNAVMVAEQHGLQDEGFVAAIIEAVETVTKISPLLPKQLDFLEIVQESLNLILQPNISFVSAKNISIVILRNAEKIIQQTVPEMVSEYLLGALKLVTAYFESIYEANGQDTLNQIISNEMKTLQSLLPQNSTAWSYISALINITQLILESGQGKMSLWEGFENASADNLQQNVHQLGKIVNTFWPLVVEGIGSHVTAPSLEAFTALVPVLENVLTGRADQNTWNKLEQMLGTLLSTLEGTELWSNLTSVIPQFEKIVETVVKNMQAENVMIQSLQKPILDLMLETVQSSNSTHVNLSEVLEKMQLAIESTIQAAHQANGTLDCSEILKVWEPVGVAADLSPNFMAMWCNISLQPVLEAYASIQNVYPHMNMSMIMGPTSVSDTAARIVDAVQSLYQVNINRVLVVNQFIMNFSNQLSMLADHSLSPEAQLYWLKQLQVTQLQNSLSSIKMLSDKLLDVDPSLQPYMEALVKALNYILDNYNLLQQSVPPEELLKEAAMIFLSSANITSHDIFSVMEGNSSASLNDLITEIIRLVINMKAFGDEPMIYQILEQYLASNGTSLIAQKVAEMSSWLKSTEASGLDLLSEALSKSYDILKPILSALSRMGMDMQETIELLEDLAGNITMFRQLLSSSNLLGVMDQHLSDSEMTAGYQTPLVRRRRDVSLTMTRNPIEDFIDLYNIDYPAMFKAMAVPPTTPEIVETAHVFFANPNLSVVMKGATSNMQWGLNASREETIDSALGILSFLTLPDVSEKSSMDILKNAVEMLPDALPYSSVIKSITTVLANESQANLTLIQEIIQSVSQLFRIIPTDPQFKENLDNLTSQVCTLEGTESAGLLMQSLNIKPGQLCHTFLPALQILTEGLVMNTTSLLDIVNQTVIGDPRSYNVHTDWTTVLSQTLGFNISSLSSLNVNATSPGVVTFGEMLRNETAFVQDVQQRMGFDPAALHLLMNSTLPNNNLVLLSWLMDLRHCNSTPPANTTETDLMTLKTLCSLSAEQWYTLSVLTTRHVNTEKVVYKMVLSDDIQSVVGVMLRAAETVTKMMDKMDPVINKLQGYLSSIKNLNLAANNEFSNMERGQRATISSQATFVTLSRALCSNGIMALFGISKVPAALESHPSLSNNPQKEEMIERFKLPRNATPFCMNMYLDMVNTTGGAIAWAFLKPMLMGQILYTPDTPTTRAIIEKANTTLHDFANLRKYSEDWIKSSTYLFDSAHKLEKTLPMLQNSLGNPFVKNFIEMQTGINIGRLEETLNNFSNMTMMLEKNQEVLNHITALSTLMVDITSCIKFDRYRGFDSADELNSAAQELAKDRNLYASVIFKLPKDADSSRNKREATSSTSSLPPKVSYTIRMHMDNVMRTDRVRNPYFVKDTHISARNTMRYNRGFIYLQESIDRAIIEAQTGQKVTDTAVQLQPFPYPCYQRDEYLEAISFVFPLMLMVAWVLFIADFVKKLVHERELRLHEYMKMMGVNTLSHFFAWFVECATYLLTTIIIMTLVLKYGKILPNSDSFLIFLYLCDYGLSIIAFSYLVSSFFDKTYIAGLSGSLLYILCFFPFIVVSALEGSLTFFQKSALGLLSPTCFSYASQYASRYEAQGEGMQWSNSYTSPLAGDTSSFGWLCWLMLIDSILYFIIGAYIRTVFPGQYGIAAPWYFPFKPSFWADLCCIQSKNNAAKGRLFTNIMQNNQPSFSNDKGKGKSALSTKAGEDFSELPVGVALHGLTKTYGDQVAIENLNVSFYEGHVTSLLGHNGAGKTTTMSLLTGLYAPSSGAIEVYGKDMQTNIDRVRKELGVCMQYDVLFDHMTTKEHLLLYGQIKAPHWSRRELREQVRTILEDTGMYAHRHKRVGTLSGGMKRKLSISIAFIGGSRLVVLDEPTTGVDPCSRRSIWDIVIQHKKNRTIIMSTHHLDEAEVLSDRIAFLEKGGLKCCGSPFYLKDKLGQGYKLTLTKKMRNTEGGRIDSAELKAFVQAHVPLARLKEAQGNDLVFSLPPFNSSNASSYRSLLTALDSNLNALQLGGYGISDTTLEEVFLQLTQGHRDAGPEDDLMSISETVSDTISIDSFSSDSSESGASFGDKIKLTSSSTVTGLALAWQQMSAILIKRFHHSRRDWKGLLSQILLPVLFVVCAMGLGSIKNDVQHYPELQLSPALYNIGPSYSFFSSQDPNSSRLADTMTSFPGMDNSCFDKPDNLICTRNTNKWSSRGNSSKGFSVCKCTQQEQICDKDNYQPPHRIIPSSQIVYNLSGINVETYLVATANDFIRNRYGGFAFGMPLPADLKMDITAVPGNRTLSKVWFNPEGHHTMPAYLNSLNNLILRSNLPADKDPRTYGISVYSQPYFGRVDDEDTIVQGLLHILVAMCVLTGFSITTASFAIYEVTEHRTGSKRLQHISGISEPFYWTVNFLYDMIIYLLPVAATIAVIAAFQIPAFTDHQNLAAITVLLVLFGFSTFPWMYLLAGVFRDAEMAFISYVCINLFISVNTISSTFILYLLGQISMRNPEEIQKICHKLSNAFLIFPQFSFGNGLMELTRNDIQVQILSGYGIDAYKNPFSLDGLGWMFISAIIQGVVFFGLRLLLNRSLIRKVRRLICHSKTVPQVACDDEDEDEDVAAEHLRVSGGAANSDILQVSRLTKVYQHFTKKVPAVKKLSVGVPAGECFGLLGVNGAGKTTTFKMLTGDISPTDGTAQIRDCDGRLVDIMECRKQGINIGYCPQVDALDDLLTGEEHLYFYARIRGISKRETDRLVNYLLKRLQLNYHRNIITDSYSCGTRRKLSTALALIGHPQILLLDEPSSGMDPRTKRHLWKIISEEVKGKCAVVLTSHSMEECEALCSRLAIMVKGQFRCLGSLQHIKNRFGSGFTVKMYLAEASCDVEKITSFMQRRFPSTYLKDQHSTVVEYHVPFAPGGLADIFDQLESNKNALQIRHFSVSQTTLDEVFINFAMGKIGMDSIPIDSEDECDSLDSIKEVQT